MMRSVVLFAVLLSSCSGLKSKSLLPDGEGMGEMNSSDPLFGDGRKVTDTVITEGVAVQHTAVHMEKKRTKWGKEDKKHNWLELAKEAETMAIFRGKDDEKEKAFEQWLADRFFRAAADASATEKRAMSAYRNHQEGQESEITTRLWQEADDLRQKAENENETFLSMEEVSRILNFTETTLSDMKIVISRLAKDSEAFHREDLSAGLSQRIEGIRFMSVGAVAKIQESIRNKAQYFNTSSQWQDDKRFVMKLAELLRDMKEEIRELHKMTSGIGMRIQHWDLGNPENMTVALSLALDGVTDNLKFRNKMLHLDTASLAYARSHEACRQFARITADLQPAYTSLSDMKATLDRMSRVVPSVLHDEPRASKMMAIRTHTLLNMAYTQHIAFKESTEIIMHKFAPLVATRFHCKPSLFSKCFGLQVSFTVLAVWITSVIW